MNSTPVARALDALAIPYRVFQHSGPVNSLEQAARERGQSPDQVIRSIVFRLAEGEYIMVLMAGATQVSWQALRKYLGVSRITMAKEDELRAVTGYEIGAVSPFGLPKPMRTLADPSVFAPAEISIGSGVRGTTIIMTTADLRRALEGVEVVTLSETSNEVK
ncbi:MAG TPA: YbaK/EbsC family protein [Anaerolineae bacterium]|nr:YbaK/EbsC family protein [Anaerolineae bacterium]